jgi:hypothetical protein
MRIGYAGLVALGLLAGCTRHETSFAPPEEGRMFEAGKMRVHPIFTQVKDWTGDDVVDGVEAVVEFTDQFGDPTKASGQILFELYEYRAQSADIRGRRVVNPWVGSLTNPDEQKAHWSRPARSYTFQLAYPEATRGRNYVLTATFERDGGGRFFGQTMIEAERRREGATTRPATTRGAEVRAD